MLKPRPLVIAATLLAATAALAHQGVQNATVMARMEGMSAIASHMKTLGDMAKGKIPFDAQTAQAAANGVADQADLIPSLFEQPETDPKSEALPTIWASYPDFTTKALATATAARQAAGALDQPQQLATALSNIGATCKSCHAAYRQ